MSKKRPVETVPCHYHLQIPIALYLKDESTRIGITMSQLVERAITQYEANKGKQQ